MNTNVLSENIKKLLLSAAIVLSLLLCGHSLRAQNTTIGFDVNAGLVGWQDTVYSGSQFPVGALIRNNSDSIAFSDSLIINGLIDTGAGYIHFGPFPVADTVIYPGQSIFVIIPGDFRDTYMGGLFRIGGNVIVVWPAIAGSSSLFNTGDSLSATVFIVDTINGTGGNYTPDEQVRCYPVPAQGLLYITSTSPSYRVKETTVYDATGQLVAHTQDAETSIDTTAWPPGIYILDVVFDNGTRRIYKIARK